MPRIIEGWSRYCSYNDHDGCDVSWCGCPHHLVRSGEEEIEEDPFTAFDAMEGKPLKSLWEVESERRSAAEES